MNKKSQRVVKAVAAALVLVASAIGGVTYAQTLVAPAPDPDDNPPPIGQPVPCDTTPYCVIKINVRDCSNVSVDNSYVKVEFTRPIRFEIGAGTSLYELAATLQDGTPLEIPGILFYQPGRGKFKVKSGADPDPKKTATIENVDTTVDTLQAPNNRQKKFQYGVYVKEAGVAGRSCTPLDPWIRNY